jgi:ABC-2 type transport system ATP-binding protein
VKNPNAIPMTNASGVPRLPSRSTGVAPVIAATGVTKHYGPVVAVDELDLHVNAGEIYALLGLNGAGKTTLIRMLLGMVRPTEGRVSLWGTPVSPEQGHVWARVGYLVESPSAYPELTVRENLRLVARLRRMRDDARVDDVIDRLGLADYTHRRVRTLSLGNIQRLGLAKAMLDSPELLVLDEPANGLDPAGVVEIRDLLRGLTEAGATVFVSSHVLAEVARLADRIGIIHHGKLIRELDTDELDRWARPSLRVAARDLDAAADALQRAGYHLRRDSHDGMLVLDDDRAVAAPDAVATLLVAAACPPTRLVVEREDLETYFLRTVRGTKDADA